MSIDDLVPILEEHQYGTVGSSTPDPSASYDVLLKTWYNMAETFVAVSETMGTQAYVDMLRLIYLFLIKAVNKCTFYI